MTRLECFKILRLEPSAGPNAIKQAYRKLAFELHPDLNPGVPDASKQFQELNEAYVLLMQEYANTSFGARSRSADHSGATGHGQADAKARAEARRAYEQAKNRFENGKQAKAENETRGAQSGTRTSGAPPGGSSPGSKAQYRKPSREEILQDLLDDPFARRVFEDIYSHVRHNTGKAQAAQATKSSARPPKKKSKKARSKPAGAPMLITAGSKVAGLANGLAGGIKGWFRKQIDDEQVMFLPGESLYPGARVRLQVRHGFSENSRTIEFTLPPEFLPGRPIRLKGLGKHLGSLKGDLYLRVYSREELPEEGDG